jgi:hypothetical protein
MSEASKVAVLTALESALVPRGLNLVGAASARAYDARVLPAHALATRFPDARSVVVIGNGGGAFWLAWRAHCATHPEAARDPDPLDAFTVLAVEAAVRPLLGDAVRVVYPFRFDREPVSFMRLAECAVLVHPVYGPWVALRAAIPLPFDLEGARPADGFDPCPTCTARTCIAACPAGAVGAAGWDVPRCAAHRAVEPDPCASRCHARVECVIGREHRYPDEALAHHQRRARAAVAAFATRAAR